MEAMHHGDGASAGWLAQSFTSYCFQLRFWFQDEKEVQCMDPLISKTVETFIDVAGCKITGVMLNGSVSVYHQPFNLYIGSIFCCTPEALSHEE